MTKANSINVVRMRGYRLDASGAPDAGPGNLYVHGAPVQFPWDPQYADRESYRQTLADGTTCVVYDGPPRGVESITFNGFQLCEWDDELIEFLAGGTVFTATQGGSAVAGSGGTDPGITRGWMAPDDSTVNANGVALELWSIAWNGRSRLLIDGLPAYHLWVFPMTTWQLAAPASFREGVHVFALNGVGSPSSSFDTGPFGEVPIPVTTPFAHFVTNAAPPAVSDGYATLTPT